MKSLILGVLTLASVNAFAQQQVSPAEVCQNISRYSSSNGVECAQAISRGRFDSTVTDVANAVASTGASSSATRIMIISPNRYLDDVVARACKEIARYSSANAVTCVEAALDNAFTPALAEVAEVIAKTGASSSAVVAIKNATNGWAHVGASDVCKAIARYSSSNAADCVAAIINKDYYNGSESVCLTLANQGATSSAVTCMRNSGISTEERPRRRHRDGGYNGPSIPGPYNPGPAPRPDYDPYTVRVSTYDIEELARNIQKARAQYDRGNYRQLDMTIIDLQRKIDEIRATAR